MTRIRWRTFFPVWLSVLAFPWVQPATAQVEVTHVANEGFLLKGGGGKVLIDALFDGIEGYRKAGENLAAELRGARAGFDQVDLILATHSHDDHFSPGPVLDHLRANPRAHFLSTPQAVDRLKAAADDPDISRRLTAVLPSEGQIEAREVNGVRVEILNLHHGRDRRPPVQNLGFVIHLGGRRVLHVGDTEAGPGDFSKLRLAESPVDLALLPGWFLASSGDWRTVVKREIQPRAIAAMHLAEENAPAGYFGPDGSLEARVRRIEQNYPNAEIFTRELQRKVY